MEGTLTVTNAFDLYLQKKLLADSSVEIKERALQKFIKVMGNMPVKSITYAEAEDFKTWLVKGNGLSKKSANIYLANTRPFFRWMAKRGYIDRDPFAGIDRFRTDKRRKEIFEPAEIEKILRVADLRWQAIVLLGLCTLRRTEVLNLTISDLCFKEGYIRIRPKTDAQNTWRWNAKNYQAQIVPMPKLIMLPGGAIYIHQILKNQIIALKSQYPHQPYVCVLPETYNKIMAMQKEGCLAWEWRNCPWSNFTRDWRRILKKANVRFRRFHDLRATLPTVMARQGVPMPEVQRLMRHSSIQTTAEYYISVDEDKLVKKTAKIAAQFCKK
ncbi:MAG: tyrosine-type recombinase/integrase [Sedimentisphaerales bacterium]|nr:tyrosine-type recombinase/integrase [Sedimentisphaerales bacterium]